MNMKPLALALLIGFAPLPALAHKVIASVYPAGRAVEGEIGFSNGAMAVRQTVQVTTPQGRALGTALTDDTGLFTFTPAEPVEHVFTVDLGAGHVAETRMPAPEVAKLLGKPPAADQAAAPGTGPNTGPGTNGTDTDALAAMLRDELRPLRQEIAAYKEKNDLQMILGGMGYIAGLFGLGFYLAARRQLAGGRA
ncbi:cobalt ABC transporter permease [Phaeovulum sp. NW3]|uniref:cobalt ABC transporter permease n=1 Tax=Phaeovulum sp. NW3 TaxID=2934933 RepID=UPI0032E4A865